MEYLDGETLKDVILREGPLPERRAIDITLQLLAALRFAHRRDHPPRRQAAQRDGAARRPREGRRLRHRPPATPR
jgi:serine/threonine-protein kinase